MTLLELTIGMIFHYVLIIKYHINSYEKYLQKLLRE